MPTPCRLVVRAGARRHLGYASRVANAASDRGRKKNEGLPHRLLRNLDFYFGAALSNSHTRAGY